jgi:hypothetical protein
MLMALFSREPTDVTKLTAAVERLTAAVSDEHREVLALVSLMSGVREGIQAILSGVAIPYDRRIAIDALFNDTFTKAAKIAASVEVKP